MHQGPRQLERLRIALLREFRQRRAARVIQAQQLGAHIDRASPAAYKTAEPAGGDESLLSAVWDDWSGLPAHRDELAGSDVFTLRRRSLFQKYFLVLFIAASVPLLVSGLSDAWLSYRDQRTLLNLLLGNEARAAARHDSVPRMPTIHQRR